MCGFIGGNLFASRYHAFESLATIEHRGRDSDPEVQWVAKDFLFGHNRLSIQDLSHLADQPMTVGDITIVYNGELWKNTIDKYDALLRSKYDFFTTNSDTELLIYMYIEYGLEMFDRIDGMYSFALYDESKGQIILGRDWVGRLPFYYIENYNKVAFASEYKALSEPFYNNSADIKIMPPAHYYIWDIDESRFIEKKQYYDIRKNICKSDTEEEVVKSEIFNRLFEAVQNELIADVKLCTILSGGIDSVIITYFLKMLIPDIKSYVVNVGRGKNKDDLYYAKMAAGWLDLELEEVHVSKTQINQKLSESIWASESKVWHQVSPAVAQLFLSKKISDDGYKVVFGGEGADEIFGSYGNIQKMYYKQDTNREARISLITNLHKNNLIRTNKAMMFGGTVELRTPFLDRRFVEYGLSVVTIDAKHHSHDRYVDVNWSNGGHMKYMLRKAFEDTGMPEELLWRKKETFQVGCHTDYLRDEKERIEKIYAHKFKLPYVKRKEKTMKKSNILLRDKKDLSGIEKFFDYPVYILGAMEKLPPYILPDDIEILSTKFTKVGKTTLDRFPNLRLVITRGHGNDFVNQELCDKKDIEVVRLNPYIESCARWCVDKVDKGPVTIFGAFGTIGKRVVELLKEPTREVWPCVLPIGSEGVDADMAWNSSNTVISCISSSDENKYFFNKVLFEKFINPINFISISRQKTYNNNDLIDLLNDGNKFREIHIDTVDAHRRDELLRFSNFHYYEHSSWNYVEQNNDELFGKLKKVIDEHKRIHTD